MFIIRKLIPQVLVYNQMSHSDKVAIGTRHKQVELMSHKVEAHTDRVECARHHTFSWKLKGIQSYIDLQKVIKSSDKEDRKSKSNQSHPMMTQSNLLDIVNAHTKSSEQQGTSRTKSKLQIVKCL